MPSTFRPGKRFGSLILITRGEPTGRGGWYWKCKCVCGVHRVYSEPVLVNGRTRSCGCQSNNYKHGLTNTRLGKTHGQMMARCYNPNAPDYASYGGRGIEVCDRWHNIENFVADMGGRPPGKTLDRIDNNKDYTPQNCRWATRSQQQKNKRNYWRDGPDAGVKPHGRPTVDRVGRVYGLLTVIERVYVKGRGNLWRCRCECGNETLVIGNNLDKGNSTKCSDRKVHPPKRTY